MSDRTDFESDLEEMIKKWEVEDAKKNLRNFINQKIFPKGIADYKATHALTHPWKIINYWKREIKYAWQRVFRGWDDTAVWDIDSYLAHLIPQLMRELKKYPAIPMDMFDIEDLKNPEGINDEATVKASARWRETLESVAEGFDLYIKCEGFPFAGIKEENEEELAKFNKAFDLLRKYFGSFWN